MKIKAVAANTKPFTMAGKIWQFTVEQLNAMADSAKGKPITFNFDSNQELGLISSAYVENGELVIEADIPPPQDNGEYYFVPAITTEDYRFVAGAVTASPALNDLPFINFKEQR